MAGKSPQPVTKAESTKTSEPAPKGETANNPQTVAKVEPTKSPESAPKGETANNPQTVAKAEPTKSPESAPKEETTNNPQTVAKAEPTKSPEPPPKGETAANTEAITKSDETVTNKEAAKTSEPAVKGGNTTTTQPVTNAESTKASETVPKAEPANNPEPAPKSEPPKSTEAAVKKEPVTSPKPLNSTPRPIPRIFSYDFMIVTVDERGREVDRRTDNAKYYSEELSSSVVLEMVEIPGGTFLMGSIDANGDKVKNGYVRGVERDIKEMLLRRLNWELPQHIVKVPAFRMSKFEITQSQWRAVANLPKVNRELMSDPSQFKGGNRPVERVTWEEAMEFCERLSRATGRRYRLPTEAEWEYACRAGTNTPFYFGDAITPDWANFHGKQPYGLSEKGIYREQTVPVGTVGVANGFGLFDMAGNVWEWCLDTWHEAYDGAPTDGSAWDKGGATYLRMQRGGAWDSSGGECRSGSRNKITSTIRSNNTGFRVVAEITEQPTNKSVQASITLSEQ